MNCTYEKLNREKLECISYERSKWWSNLMNEYNKRKDNDNEEIDLEDIENGYNDSGEDIESSNSENMAEESESVNSDEDPLDAINLNVTTIPQNITQSNARGILSQIDKRANETGLIDNEVREVLEQTLPIVEEYKRNWREAGFERILNTFDIKKIEDKVGGWMRRNNSFLNNSVSPISKSCFDQCRREKPFCTYKQRESNDGSDSDSLHSIDTARYIRSSRKQLGVQKRIATTTTTIKSYCLIESKRDELRRKYAYLAPDDTMKVFNPKRCPENIENYRIWSECRSDHYGNGRKRLDLASHRIRKRRFHQRQHCQNSYSSYSTSDEDNKKEQRFCRSVRNARCRCYHKTSKLSPKNFYDQLSSSNEGYDVFLPYVHETECSCRQADKLCNNVRHVANSSAEEWLVENCLGSETLPKIVERLPRQKVKRATSYNSYCAENTKQQKLESNKDSKKSKRISSNKKEDRKSLDNSKKTLNKQKTDDTINNEDSFEYQLQQAIKLSKEQYERDMRMKNKKQLQDKKINKQNISIKAKQINKTKSKSNKLSESISENSDCDMLEESHTSSKLASQFTADLQLEDIEKNKKCSFKSISKLFDDMVHEEPEATSKLTKKNQLNFNSPNETQIINLKHIIKPNENQKRSIHTDLDKLPKASNSVANTSDSEQLASQTFIRNPILNTEEIQKEFSIENGMVYSDFKDNKNFQKAQKRYNSTSSLSSTMSSEIENKTNVRKKLGSKKSILKVIKENELEEKGATDDEVIKNTESDIKKIQFLNTSTAFTSNLSENSTIFGNSVNICNSTAINHNNTATTRQLHTKSLKATKSNIKPKRIKSVKSDIMNKKLNHEDKDVAGTTILQSQKNLQTNVTIPESQTASLKEVNDCTVVSSTTDTDFQVTVVSNTIKRHQQQPDGRVVLYTPQNTSLAPDHSIVNGRFKITEDHLASVIGKEAAYKFMKYYVGPRDFRLSSTVYYRPPKCEAENISSDSDMDFLDLCSRYGELHESKS